MMSAAGEHVSIINSIYTIAKGMAVIHVSITGLEGHVYIECPDNKKIYHNTIVDSSNPKIRLFDCPHTITRAAVPWDRNWSKEFEKQRVEADKWLETPATMEQVELFRNNFDINNIEKQGGVQTTLARSFTAAGLPLEFQYNKAESSFSM